MASAVQATTFQRKLSEWFAHANNLEEGNLTLAKVVNPVHRTAIHNICTNPGDDARGEGISTERNFDSTRVIGHCGGGE